MPYPELKPLILDGPGPFALIGDIHGCFTELTELVGKIITKTGRYQDEITWISLGDVCDRGPNVHECFRFLRNLKAHIVLGNHDEKLLRWAKGNKVRIGSSQTVSLQSMQPEDFEQLKSMVPFVRLPYYNAIGVHGGFFPGIKPEKQDLKQIIRLRRIDPLSKKMHQLSDGEDKGVFWAEAWEGPEHVYFGHAWDKTIRQFPSATALDTGCVYGGHLSAAVLRNDVNAEHQIFQVPAKKVYWEDTQGD